MTTPDATRQTPDTSRQTPETGQEPAPVSTGISHDEECLAHEVLAEIELSGRGGGRKSLRVLDWHIVRSLTSEDIPALLAPPPVPPGMSRQVQMRHAHHQLAQCLAKGIDDTEASLISGYSTNYISILRGDPSFQELLANYGEERKAVFVDVMERMKALGLHTLEELQARMEEDPDKFSNRELQELAKMLLIDVNGKGGGAGAGAGGGGVSVSVSFVTASAGQQVLASSSVSEGLILENDLDNL